MIDNRAVGRTIATLRQANGMTQQQLAAAMNVSHQAVSKWENGAALPDIQTLMELTRLFGITVEQLLSGEIPDEDFEEEKKPTSIDGHFQRIGSFVSNVVEDIGNSFRSSDEEETSDADVHSDGEAADGRVDFKKLLEMAPFMKKKTVQEVLEKSGMKLTAAEIVRLAPFLESSYLEKRISELEGEFSWENLRRIAPHLKKDVVDAFARAIALGEKYIKPATNEIDDVWLTMNAVSRKIERGVDKAIRKVVKFGENTVNEVTKAFDDLTSETMTRDERIAKLRRSAFERAIDDGRWEWIAAHIDEAQDEELRRRICEAANRQGMQEWVFEHLGDCADPAAIDKAIADGDWNWLGENIDRFDAATQRRVAKCAMQAENWDWLGDCMEQIDLTEIAAEIAATARRAGAQALAAKLVRSDMNADQIECLAKEAAADSDVDFIEMIADAMQENVLCECCVRWAQEQRWAYIERMSEKISMETVETLIETAIDLGDFDGIDRLDAILKAKETEESGYEQ